LVLNRRGGDLWDFANHKSKPVVKRRWIDGSDPWFKHFKPLRAQILGSHNQDNLAVAFAIAEELGWPEQAYEAMLAFCGLPHRVENLGEFNGVRFVNDSKATTMESVKIAVKSVLDTVPEGAKLLLLLGGKDKDLPWRELADLGKEPKVEVIFFGSCAEKAKIISSLNGPTVSRLKDTFPLIAIDTKPGDTVLLCPGGTSLDEFKNFEERGREFARMVKENFSN
jgi:UDP-N-acetylmuramoylalanine--D-glutamate ligase